MAARNRFRLPLVVALLVLFLMPVSLLAAQATPVASPVAATPASSAASLANVVDLDVLFIGAHPDDEAFGLSTYGQWNEVAGITTGVITVTPGRGWRQRGRSRRGTGARSAA